MQRKATRRFAYAGFAAVIACIGFAFPIVGLAIGVFAIVWAIVPYLPRDTP